MGRVGTSDRRPAHVRALGTISIFALIGMACTLTTSLRGFSTGEEEPLGDDAGAETSFAMTDAGGDASSYVAVVRADQPVGFWRLGEANANDKAKDEMGAHHGDYIGA